jgi:hypothetical protein
MSAAAALLQLPFARRFSACTGEAESPARMLFARQISNRQAPLSLTAPQSVSHGWTEIRLFWQMHLYAGSWRLAFILFDDSGSGPLLTEYVLQV